MYVRTYICNVSTYIYAVLLYVHIYEIILRGGPVHIPACIHVCTYIYAVLLHIYIYEIILRGGPVQNPACVHVCTYLYICSTLVRTYIYAVLLYVHIYAIPYVCNTITRGTSPKPCLCTCMYVHIYAVLLYVHIYEIILRGGPVQIPACIHVCTYIYMQYCYAEDQSTSPL